jgi:maleylpyruvate isomerase
MEMEPQAAIDLCLRAHERFSGTIRDLDDSTARQPSRLPGWSVGHVITHLARNADGHIRRLEGALIGVEVPRYPGGPEQRDREIDEGEGRPAAEIVRDFNETAARLEAVWAGSEQAGWPHAELRGPDKFDTSGSPLRRLREVEVHHVDLGLGYEPTDWPAEYVEWELPTTLARLPERLAGEHATALLLAWLIGRSPSPVGVELRPWM